MVRNVSTKDGSIIKIVVNGKNSGKDVIVNEDDIATLGNNTVFVSDRGYAYIRVNGEKKSIHSLVVGFNTDRNTVIDHINGDPLDNRRENLRVVEQRANSRNRHQHPSNTTGVIGISKFQSGGYKSFRVQLTDPRSKLSPSGQGSRIQKSFNINRLGEEMAFEKAKAWLNDQKELLNY